MRDSELALWSSAIDEFPLDGTLQEQLRALVPFAVRAPSSHNSQPWRFRVRDDVLEVHTDPDRRLPVADPSNREQIISCGAAVGCAEVALRNFGYEGTIQLAPKGAAGKTALVATIGLGNPWMTTPEDRALFEAISQRRTNRFPFLHQAPGPEILTALVDRGNQLGVWLENLQSESSRLTLAELISEGDRKQMADQDFRSELAEWVHPNRSQSRDGMPGWTFGAGNLESLALPTVLRTFDTGAGRAAIDASLAQGSPVLAILGTDSDTCRDWVQTGRVLTRVLLLATVHGLAASYLNQPIEVSSLRERVGALLGRSGFPQIVVRIGYPTERARSTPRRSIPDVLET